MAKVPVMTEQSKQRLAKAAERVSDFIDEGCDPNTAVAKAAAATSLPPEHIPLLCNSSNIALLETQRLTGRTTAEKSAAVAVADSDQVLKILFDSQPVKKAEAAVPVATEYGHPLHWLTHEKTAASKVTPDTVWIKPKAAAETSKPQDPIAYAELCRRIEKEARAVFRKYGDEFNFKMARLRDSIWTSPAGTYAEILRDGPLLYGELVEPLTTRACGSLPSTIKSAKATHRPVDEASKPYTLLRDIIGSLDRLQKAATAMNESARERKKAEIAAELAAPEDAHKGCLQEKMGGLATQLAGLGIGGGMASSIYGNMTNEYKNPDKSTAFGPDDLKTLSEIRNAEIAATLGNLMSNDDVISKARPEEVFHHYNQLSAIAPLVMSDPSTAQALLRRRIEGGKNAIDPYDIDLTLKLDKGFRDRYRSASPKDE